MSASNDGYCRVRWTFLTNHARALVCIADDPQVRLREIAQRIGVTERAAQSLVNDLVDAGYVTRTRVGRRNRYEIDATVPLRHAHDHQLDVGTLLTAFQRKPECQDAPGALVGGPSRRPNPSKTAAPMRVGPNANA